MKNVLKNLFGAIDVFPYPINVLFLSKNTISTEMSIISSWVFCAILLASFSQSDMWHKRSPRITDQTVDSGAAILNLNNDNFALNIWLYDQDSYYANLDPSYGTIEAIAVKYNISIGKYVKESIPLTTNCSKNDTENEISGTLCIADREIPLYVAESMWNGDFSFLDIQLNYCSNETSLIPCQPLDVMRNFFKGKMFSYNIKQNLFNFRNYETPAKIESGNAIEIIVTPEIYQCFIYSLMEVILYQDSNPIFGYGEEFHSRYFQIDSSKTHSQIFWRDFENLNIQLFENKTIVEVQFYPNRNRREVIRKYETLIETLSSLGGLASFLKMLGFVFSTFGAKVKILRQLHQHIYAEASYPSPENIEIENEHPKIDLKENGCSLEMSHRNKNDLEDADQSNFTVKESPNIMKSSTIRKLQTKKKRNEENPKFNSKWENQNKTMTFWEFLVFKFHSFVTKKLSDKDRVIAEIEKSYIRDFDILNLLRRIKNLELLKSVVFNETERKLYEIIEGKQFSFNENPQLRQNEIEGIIKYYEEKQSEFKLSEREMRLWEIYLTRKT